MAERKIKLLKTATEEEILQLADVMLDAFPEDDPSKIGMLGGRMDLRPEYSLAIVRAALLEGDVWVVEVDGKWVTVGLWFKWPKVLFSTDAQRKLGFNDFFKKLSPEMQHWSKIEFRQQMDAWYEQKKISDEEWDRIWYCNLLATHSKEQGRGHANALVEHVLAEVKTRNNGMMGLATGTEVNVAKYKSMGFIERGHTTIHTLVNSFVCTWLTREV